MDQEQLNNRIEGIEKEILVIKEEVKSIQQLLIRLNESFERSSIYTRTNDQNARTNDESFERSSIYTRTRVEHQDDKVSMLINVSNNNQSNIQNSNTNDNQDLLDESLKDLNDDNTLPPPSTPSKKTKKTLFKKDSIEYILAEGLFLLIRKRLPNFRIPNLQKWSGEIDRMIRLDKRDPEEIAEIIEWSQKNTFWKRNILSTGKLRKQYDLLFAQKGEEELKFEDQDLVEFAKKLYLLFRDRFMNNKKSFQSIPEKQKRMFLRGSERLTAFCKKRKYSRDEFAIVLIDALDETRKDDFRIIYPSQICSEATWMSLFPQYVRRNYT